MFIGRNEELNFLESQMQSERFEMIPIYGRRRVGKTRLIEEFTKTKKTIFFTADQLGDVSNLRNLSKAITSVIGELSSNLIFEEFQDAFETIAKYAQENNEPTVFIIDEYPYLAGTNAGISSVLQRVIDKMYLKIPNLMLILTGSQMSFMERQVLGYESPLYGRRTGQIKLLPLTFNEAREFLPNMDEKDFLTIYGITGGIPLYLSSMNDKLSLKENIMQKLLTRNTLLYEEPKNLLLQELRTPDRYNAILIEIARGANRLNEIADKTGIESGLAVSYIKTLIELDIIEKREPMLKFGKKRGIYYIKDGLFHFWYRYVPSYMNFVTQGRIEQVWSMIEEDLIQFTSLIFEDYSRNWLLYNSSVLISEIGSWWGNNPLIKSSKASAEEIDIVGIGLNGDLVIGECKWRNEKTGIRVGEKLLERAQFFSYENKHLYIFSKSEFTEELKNYAAENKIELISYDEMVQK